MGRSRRLSPPGETGPHQAGCDKSDDMVGLRQIGGDCPADAAACAGHDGGHSTGYEIVRQRAS